MPGGRPHGPGQPLWGDGTPDGTCVRGYIHVTDLAQAHVLGAGHIMGNRTSLPANLGSGSGYSVQEVIDAAGTFVDVPFAYAGRRPGDPAQLVASVQRARDVLGRGPRLDLRAILKSDYDFRKRLACWQAQGAEATFQ